MKPGVHDNIDSPPPIDPRYAIVDALVSEFGWGLVMSACEALHPPNPTGQEPMEFEAWWATFAIGHYRSNLKKYCAEQAWKASREALPGPVTGDREALAMSLRELAKRNSPGAGTWKQVGEISRKYWLEKADEILKLIFGDSGEGNKGKLA